MERIHFNIDVLGMGGCNLRCPSCPVGNSRTVPNPKGLMSPETLRAILAKAVTECEVAGVGLFNWTEPLLHPKLPELIGVVHEFGVRCDLSSNLNQIKNIDAVLAANPASLRISNSGFTQETYGVTHRGGDIEKVKANMKELAEALRRTGSTTRVHMLYHRYRTNLDDEVPMRRFCESLGFEFYPIWAYVMPLEKLLAWTGADPTAAEVTAEDRDLIDRLLLPLPESLELGRRHRNTECVLQSGQVTLDFRGDVQLCCAVYDASKHSLGPYLERPLADFQAAKYASETCTRCMDQGVHVYYTQSEPEEFARLAHRNTPWKHRLRVKREKVI